VATGEPVVTGVEAAEDTACSIRAWSWSPTASHSAWRKAPSPGP